MMTRWLRKYFAVVFMLASLLGGMHHHNDLKQHSDCKICIVQSTMLDADTPTPTYCMDELVLFAQTPATLFATLISYTRRTTLTARAPPQFS